MQKIFNRNDFVLCEVPVPNGYKQSQTHVGVSSYKDVTFLTTSPYPVQKETKLAVYFKAVIRKLSCNRLFKQFIPEQWENPCLYISANIQDHYPTRFELLQKTPLMSPPDPYYGLPAYNSDPDLLIEDGVVHVLNRSVFRIPQTSKEQQNNYVVRLYHIYGIVDKNQFKYEGTELLFESDRNVISPCMTKYNGMYVMTELETNSYNDGKSYNGLYIARSKSIADFRNKIEWKGINVDCLEYLPWHMSLFQVEGVMYTVISCVKKGISHRCFQLLGVFNNDLSKLKIYKTPLTDFNSYRGSAFVTKEGEFVLYSTTVNEFIKGSKSIDGRDVILAHMPFLKMMTLLNDFER